MAHSGQEYAHVLYVDGDEEDIPLQEVGPCRTSVCLQRGRDEGRVETLT